MRTSLQPNARFSTTVRIGLAVLTVGFFLAELRAQLAANGQSTRTDSAGQITNSPPAAPTVESVPLAQWRAELAGLGSTNAESDKAISAWLDRLLAGQLPKEIWFDVLEPARKHNSAEIKQKLQRYQAKRVEEGGLATVSELLYGGNAERGRKIFFEKPEAVCIKCHKVGNVGGEIGPQLGAAATNMSREYILESVLFPNAQITPGYETVSIITKNREGFAGILKNETDTELTLNSPEGLFTIKKADIASRRKTGSLMPDGLDMTISQRELRDVVEFLSGLKQQGGARDTSFAGALNSKNSESPQTAR